MSGSPGYYTTSTPRPNNVSVPQWQASTPPPVYDTKLTPTLHPAFYKLADVLQEIGYGEAWIKIQDGLPVMVERAYQQKKLL